MTLDWLPAKRDLGVIYLVGVGFIFTVMVFREAFSVSSPSIDQLLSLTAGFFLAVGLIGVGYWLLQSPLGDDRVLVVSQLGALGMAIPTLIIVLGVFFLPLEPTAGLLVTVIGAAGIVGTLLGSVKALESEHRSLNELYRRTRVLRHNIRNGMTVVQGYADLLEADLDGARVDRVQNIRQEAGSIVDLSEMARNLDSLEEDQYRHPIDIVAVIEELIDSLHRNYPTATVQTDMPESVAVQADNFIELAFWELLEYAVRNSEQTPVDVTVSQPANGPVRVLIQDQVSELSEAALQALERGSETQMQHLDGMELWVATWLVENMDGSIAFETAESSGLTVELTLPPAEGPVQTTHETLEANASPR